MQPNLRFSWREIAQEMAWPSRRVQKLVCQSSILSIRICDLSAQFPVNCFEKFLWQQTIADLIQSTFCLILLVREEPRKKKEAERNRVRISIDRFHCHATKK